MKILLERPASLRTACPNLPPALEAVILKCLEKDPARRLRDIGEFIKRVLLTIDTQLSIEYHHPEIA